MFWLVMILAVLGDQISKMLISGNLALGESIPVIDGFLDFTYIINRGASFSILQGQRIVFIILTVLVLAAIIFIAVRKIPRDYRLFLAMLGLFCGGTIGNFIDRIRLGGVTDFIDLGWFPVFNVADCCICIGAVLLCALLIFGKAGKLFVDGNPKKTNKKKAIKKK